MARYGAAGGRHPRIRKRNKSTHVYVMKIKNRISMAQSCLLTAALAGSLITYSAQAATALNGRVVSRPVTPGDVTRYSLPSSTENSGGLYTFAIGTPTYLEADVNIAVPKANITSVTWALTAKPLTSTATITASPLPTNMPVFLPSDVFIYQVAGRALLRPDVAGQYRSRPRLSRRRAGQPTRARPSRWAHTSGSKLRALPQRKFLGRLTFIPRGQPPSTPACSPRASMAPWAVTVCRVSNVTRPVTTRTPAR